MNDISSTIVEPTVLTYDASALSVQTAFTVSVS